MHCPNVVGGQAPQLARSERRLGLDSWCIAITDSPYGYPADEVLSRAAPSQWTREIRRWGTFLRALSYYDVIHFNFGSTLMPCNPYAKRIGSPWSPRALAQRVYAGLLCMKDLWFLKKAGKVLFMTYQGDDARQGDICRRRYEIHFVTEVPADYYPRGSDEVKRRRIATVARYADRIYGLNPDLLHLLPEQARFLPYANVDIEAWQPVPAPGPGPLRVVHAPSNRAAKGTRFLVDAVAALRREGVSIELDCVEGLSREEARHRYAKAHVVVDQLLAGWYGGLAVEAMALGKPVVGFIREADLRFVSPEMRAALPIIGATPESVREVLRELARAPRENLERVGARSRAFVEAWHDPLKVAQRTKQDYLSALEARNTGVIRNA